MAPNHRGDRGGVRPPSCSRGRRVCACTLRNSPANAASSDAAHGQPGQRPPVVACGCAEFSAVRIEGVDRALDADRPVHATERFQLTGQVLVRWLIADAERLPDFGGKRGKRGAPPGWRQAVGKDPPHRVVDVCRVTWRENSSLAPPPACCDHDAGSWHPPYRCCGVVVPDTIKLAASSSVAPRRPGDLPGPSNEGNESQ